MLDSGDDVVSVSVLQKGGVVLPELRDRGLQTGDALHRVLLPGVELGKILLPKGGSLRQGCLVLPQLRLELPNLRCELGAVRGQVLDGGGEAGDRLLSVRDLLSSAASAISKGDRGWGGEGPGNE